MLRIMGPGVATVKDAEECRREATWCMRVARLTKSQDASASWRRLSDAWLTLAEHIHQRPSSETQPSTITTEPPPAAHQRTIAAEPPPEPVDPRIAAMKVADFLRERLALDAGPRAEGPKA
jgi:hypothetical protein